MSLSLPRCQVLPQILRPLPLHLPFSPWSRVRRRISPTLPEPGKPQPLIVLTPLRLVTAKPSMQFLGPSASHLLGPNSPQPCISASPQPEAHSLTASHPSHPYSPSAPARICPTERPPSLTSPTPHNPTPSAGGLTRCAFCTGCHLEPGRECTPDGITSQCCTTDGKRAGTNETCTSAIDGSVGYCVAGECVSTICAQLAHAGVGAFCGLHADNPCKLRCHYGGTCHELEGVTLASSPGAIKPRVNHLPLGTPCSNGGNTCAAGLCIPGVSVSGRPLRRVMYSKSAGRWTMDNGQTV